MIPQSFIQEWSAQAPWPVSRQVEQDLIISRALCDLFSDSHLSARLAFRGGTAINKLLFVQPLRYSEDIDLVQTIAEPIGPTVNSIRQALSWLGHCKVSQAGHSIHLLFKFEAESDQREVLKLKVEINTREHKSLLGVFDYPFSMASSWHKAETNISSFRPEELLGTKLRALLQRQKNRDLFDLSEALEKLPVEPDTILACCDHYLSIEGSNISRAEAEQRMLKKLSRSLTEDVGPLLPNGIGFSETDALSAFAKVWSRLIVRMRGESWRLTPQALEKVAERFPEIDLQMIKGF